MNILSRKKSILLTMGLLVCVLCLTCGSVGVSAASGNSITTYMTVSIAGELGTDKNGEPVASVPVKVTPDLDGNSASYSYEDALIALHSQYYKGGAKGFACNSGWVTKYWGIDTSALGFYLNNEYPNTSIAETPVKNGDYLASFSYSDVTAWSDGYAYFNANTKALTEGKSVTFNLKKKFNDENWNLITSDIANAAIVINGKTTSYTTDTKGNVTIPFDKVGKYIVSAKATDGTYITAPVCAVTVTRSLKDGAAKVSLAKLSYTYTGKAVKPGVTVKYNGVKLKKGKDYTVFYSKNTKVGTATATIKGKGNYSGTVKKTFKIAYKLVSYKTKARINYRTGAGTSYKSAGTLSKGKTVKVVANGGKKVGSATWQKIKINGRYYWVNGKYLKK